mmetsp:Transcript_21284/g.82625  ORF Transcript_21284/g.82625 Transcript_21284/m.82625 type:complete len:209 (-) Transcript_21284:120-746(-)
MRRRQRPGNLPLHGPRRRPRRRRHRRASCNWMLHTACAAWRTQRYWCAAHAAAVGRGRCRRRRGCRPACAGREGRRRAAARAGSWATNFRLATCAAAAWPCRAARAWSASRTCTTRRSSWAPWRALSCSCAALVRYSTLLRASVASTPPPTASTTLPLAPILSLRTAPVYASDATPTPTLALTTTEQSSNSAQSKRETLGRTFRTSIG